MLEGEIMSNSTDSSYYSNDSYYYSDDDELFYGMGGMYGGVLEHAPPSPEDYNSDPSRDRSAILLGELHIPVKASGTGPQRACLTSLLQYSYAGPAS
jgi:hypothetical protein